PETYALFPCSRDSNVNGVGAGLDDPLDFMTLKDPAIVAFQEAFVRKVTAELNDLDNIYYEICNEPGFRRDGDPEEGEQRVVAWHAHVARTLREAEERLPHRHLIAANAHLRVKAPAAPGEPDTRHEDLSYFENPDIDIVNYHYISAKADARGW